MGTPVITLVGERLISRQTGGMLEAVGIGEFAARDVEGFVAIGKRWAADREALNSLRSELRRRMAESPLVDGAGYTRELEDKLQEIWRLALGHGA